MIVAIAGFAVLFALERFLFDAAFRVLPSPYHRTGHVVNAETYLLWGAINGAALVVLGPFIFALKLAGSFRRPSQNGASRLRRLAMVLMFGFAGTVMGAAVGFVIGLVAGNVVDPSVSNPHNYGGLERALVTVAVTIAGACIGFTLGLVQYSRRATQTEAPGDINHG
jgi:hypothetical protein